ncbi:hypothetical protein NPIL_359011 [Nephila pilipes]|uniref:Secreted protein n=1 Tax=Nephila pilipes TaxID=299642 RepID=A0A8X6NBQ7_NEPPI|nr:hypothetical protein NPIL_359011 [Nephila pilipes]
MFVVFIMKQVCALRCFCLVQWEQIVAYLKAICIQAERERGSSDAFYLPTYKSRYSIRVNNGKRNSNRERKMQFRTNSKSRCRLDKDTEKNCGSV